MTKAKFIRKYRKLNAEDRADVKAYWENRYKGAHFIETLDTAERVLLWIREAENK